MSNQHETTSQKQIFRRNLHRLASSRRLTFDDLAAALGMRGDHKKWLSRVWEKGLEWPDPRTQYLLSKLCEFFEVPQSDLWSPTFQVGYEHVLPDKEAWRFLVEKIIEKYRFFQQAKLRKTELVLDILKDYNYSETDYIADVVADDLGYRSEHRDESWFYDMFEDLQSEMDYHADIFGLPIEYVYTRASKHPKWPEFEEKIKAELREQGMTTEQDFFETMFFLVELLQVRVPSPPEIYDQFVRTFLEGEPHPAFEDLLLIMQELSSHPQWESYCLQHEGDAEDDVGQKWRESRAKYGSTITPQMFVEYMKTNYLDVLAPPDKDDK